MMGEMRGSFDELDRLRMLANDENRPINHIYVTGLLGSLYGIPVTAMTSVMEVSRG